MMLKIIIINLLTVRIILYNIIIREEIILLSQLF